MKKSIFLFFAAILCAMTANAATVTSDGTARLYFKMSAVNWWIAGNNGDGNFAYFYNNSTEKNAWSAHAVKYNGNDYYITIPEGSWAAVILTRNNTSTAPDWSNKWNQTGDITLSSTSNYISKFSDGSATVTWGTAVKPASNAAVSAAASTIFVGASTTLTPSLTSNATINDIKSTTYTISPATGASISGNTFTATAEGTYTIKATVTYHPDGYSSLTSTATATTTIKAEVPAEETHDVTISYMCAGTSIKTADQVAAVGEETASLVEAPEISNYTFSSWTLGSGVTSTDDLSASSINIKTLSTGDYTLTANYEKFKLTYTVTVPAGTENCYLVGEMNGWDVDNPIEMANQGNNIFKVVLEDVTTDMQYKYISKKGTWDYSEVGDNRTWTANDVVTAWKDPLATDLYLRGTMNNWETTNQFKKATAEATTASVTITLPANTNYTFLVANGDWGTKYGDGSFTATATKQLKSGGQDVSLKTVAAGDYVFDWDIDNKKLTITYPEVPTPEYKDITIQVYAKQVPNIWWWNGGDQCHSTADLVNPSTGNKYQWNEAPAMEAVVGEDNWYTKTFQNVDITQGGIKFKLKSQDQSIEGNELQTTEDKCYDARVITAVTETTCGELPSGEVPTVTYKVTVPTGTPACYIAGEMNGWSHQAMTKVDETHYTITIEGAQKTQEYKYSASNNWDCVELNEDGSEKSNRTWTENDVVAKWATPAAPVPTTYTVAGDSEAAFGTTWDPTNTANDMALEGDLYKWTKTNVALYANTVIKFQVVKNHDWAQGQWPGHNNDWELKDGITADGLYTITITFKENDKTITATATKTGDIVTKDFSNQPATLYFHPSFHWTSDAAQFAAYFYNNGPGADATPTWVNMTDGNGDGIYEVANAKQHEYVIICRMNPSRTENRWNQEGDEDAKKPVWNQIQHGITIPNAAGDLNTCLAFWQNCQGDVPTSECTWVAPTPLTDKNWSAFVTTYAGKTINAVVERSFKSGQYHTLCLPFDIPTNWLGEGTKAYQLTSIVANNTGDKLSLNATLWNTIEAGQPYIIVPVKGSEYEHVIINGVKVKNVSAGTNVASGAGYKATLKAVTATDGTQTNGSTEYYVGANDGKLYNAQTNKLGLRAIIELTTTGGQPLPAKVRAYVAAEENEATGFENIVAPEGQAMKVIENGQLIIIRGNEKFNAQGVRF